jgi:hypothetical protein
MGLSMYHSAGWMGNWMAGLDWAGMCVDLA